MRPSSLTFPRKTWIKSACSSQSWTMIGRWASQKDVIPPLTPTPAPAQGSLTLDLVIQGSASGFRPQLYLYPRRVQEFEEEHGFSLSKGSKFFSQLAYFHQGQLYPSVSLNSPLAIPILPSGTNPIIWPLKCPSILSISAVATTVTLGWLCSLLADPCLQRFLPQFSQHTRDTSS